jgi:predicted negative regulator of RcsB-dependent stress response
MAEDYLTDDEQLEHVKRVVADNWLWVGGGIVLGAALIFGYRYHDAHQNDLALRAAAQFDDMASALEQDAKPRARQIADGLVKTFPGSPYADQALLVLARLAVDDAKPADAVAPLTQVMDGSKDDELRHIARLRLARVLIDAGKPDDALKLLAAAGPGAFSGLAHEVRGDAFYAKQDTADALSEYKAALDGGVDAAVLQLKIADLGTPPPTPSNEAKP